MSFILYNHVGSGNHGCEALVRTISSVFGEENTILLSDSVDEENKFGINEKIRVYNAKEKNTSKIDFLKAYLNLKIFKNYFYMDILPYKKVFNRFDKTDILVSIGGDIFCYENYPKYILIHNEALKHVDKSILVGCSIEPKNLEDKRLLSDLKSFDLITARESITLNALKNAGITNVEFFPDTAFSLECEETILPDNFEKGNTVGLNISPLVLNKSENPELLMNNYRILIRHILKTTSSSVALIPHVSWKENDDSVPLKVLYDEFSDSNRVCLITDQSATKLKWIISNCNYFIGARTHATIAAYSSNIPTLVLGYSVKSRGIAKDLFGDDQNYVLSYDKIENEDTLLKSFLWIVNNSKDIKDVLEKKNKEYSILIEKMNSVIKKYI